MIARSALYDPANLLHPWFLRTIAKVGKVAALDLAGRPRFRVPTRIFPDPAPDPAVTMPGFGPRAWIDRRRLDTIRAAQGMLLKDALADIPKSAYQGGMHSD